MKQTFGDLLGYKHRRAEGDSAVVELELGSEHMSRAERVHGGVLFSLLDTAMGRAVISALPTGKGCATVEMKINFFRPVQSGRVKAIGRLVNLTRHTAYTEGELHNEEGKLVAKTSGTFFITDTRKQSERERV